jgi:hypothetical protein
MLEIRHMKKEDSHFDDYLLCTLGIIEANYLTYLPNHKIYLNKIGE